MSDGTLQRLTDLAGEMSTAERKVSPMQLAAQLLEEALGRVRMNTTVTVEEIAEDIKGEEQSPPTPIKIRPSRGEKRQDKGGKCGHRRKKA
jgi:hypothetical protein